MPHSPPAPRLRIVADANIPRTETLFGRFGEVVRLSGEAIDAKAVAHADVLLVRSVTTVDAAVLEGSRIRFVGSATIGTDHVDLAHLQEHGIAFAYAPGSNAESVVEYVVAALLAVFADRGGSLRGRTAGVVGCGRIGARLAERLPALGMDVLCNDPPLVEAAEAASLPHAYRPLAEVLDAADVLTLHPPLQRSGPHATVHLIGEPEMRRMPAGAWLINASRGAVVDNDALRRALASGRLGGAVLDVWEGEPTPNVDLVSACAISTPHIAGYSYDGKVRGALMLADALAAWVGMDPDPSATTFLEPPEMPVITAPADHLSETAWLDALVRQAYDVRADDARMRSYVDLPPAERAAHFQKLRRTYPHRRSFGWHRVSGPIPAAYREAVARGLRMRVDQDSGGRGSGGA